MTPDGRRPLIGCIVYYLKNMFTTPTLTATAQLTPNWKSYQLSKPEIEFHVMEINVRGIMHVRMCKKDDICWQRRLNHSGVGGGIAFRRVYPARAYATVVVLVRLDIKMCLIEKITCVLFLAYLIDLNIPRLKRWQLQARNVFK